MTPADFEFLRRFLKERSGLILTDDKQYLIESRLMPVARKFGVAGISDIASKLKGVAPALESAVVEAMTTNESFFFRDKTPFDNFKEVMLPSLLKARSAQKKLRIWCAAASTGQEPYTLAMILDEMKTQLSGWKIEILGTDLSTEVLDRAKAGVYTQFEVQRGLPIQLLMKYFTQQGDSWVISSHIRSMVQYRPLNLLRDFSSLGIFDIIYCRNVLIYFDQPTKIDVLDRSIRNLATDGYMMLGAAETVVGLTESYKPHPDRRGIYVPNSGPRQASRFAVIGGGLASGRSA